MAKLIAERDEQSELCARLEIALSDASTRILALEVELAAAEEESTRQLDFVSTEQATSNVQIQRLSSELEVTQNSVILLTASLEDQQAAHGLSMKQQADLQSTHDELIASFDSTTLLYSSTLAQVHQLELNAHRQQQDRAIQTDETPSSADAIVIALEAQLRLASTNLIDVTSRMDFASQESTLLKESLLAVEISLRSSESTIEVLSTQIEETVVALANGQVKIESMQSAYDALLVEGQSEKEILKTSELNKSTLLMELKEMRRERETLVDRVGELERDLNASETLSASVSPFSSGLFVETDCSVRLDDNAAYQDSIKSQDRSGDSC